MTHFQTLPDSTGTLRVLSAIPTDSATRKLSAPFSELLLGCGLGATIPVSEWREVDHKFSLEFILNQLSTSGCVGFSGSGALMEQRAIRGFKLFILSGAFNYAHINGGRDAGAMIGASPVALMKYGTCRAELCDTNHIFMRQLSDAMKQDAERFKLRKSIAVDNWQELCTAIQLNKIVQIGVAAAGGFMSGRLDDEGCPPAYRGVNHATRVRGMKKMARGGWKVEMANTWGRNWALNGTCYLTERHMDTYGYGDCFAYEDVEPDPQDEANVPPSILV